MIVKKNPVSITANALTKHTIRLLDLKGFNVWRQNNGGVYDPTNKVFRRNSSTPGISDIIGYHKKTGKFIAVEIKIGKDKLSPYQEQFLSGVNKAGGIGVVIKDMDELEKFAKQFN